MNLITKSRISRRTLLRGAGCAIGLPLLDAMHPALSAAPAAPRRLAVVYVPNGIIMNDWSVNSVGRDFELSRILKPLAPHRNDITIVSGLMNHAPAGVKGGGHAKASGSFLSASAPKYTVGADVHAGTTFDQLVAQRFASETRVNSLQLGCEDSRMIGNCDTGSSCAYTNSISWKNPDTPLAVETNPRSVFERLFGTVDYSLSADVRARRALYRRGILDQSRESTQRLSGQLGKADKRKLDEYLTSIREVEQRIQLAEKDTTAPPVDKPSGIPFEFASYVKLMFDLQTIAFQADLTRVSTLMMGREGSVRTYPEIGVPDPHHPLTHHRGHPDFIEKVTKINCFHAELFAAWLTQLKETKDANGSLLDNATILYGGAISDGNSHSYVNLPLLVAGHAGGIKGGAHIAAPAKTPVSNLFVEMLNRAGFETEKFGDSTGRVDLA
jgi:hypothetical protein